MIVQLQSSTGLGANVERQSWPPLEQPLSVGAEGAGDADVSVQRLARHLNLDAEGGAFVSGWPMAAWASRSLAAVIFGLRPSVRPRPRAGQYRPLPLDDKVPLYCRGDAEDEPPIRGRRAEADPCPAGTWRQTPPLVRS